MLAMYKDKSGIINVDQIKDFYIGERPEVRADVGAGKSYRVADYSSYELAQEALISLMEAAARGDKTFTFPSEDALRSRIRVRPVTAWHHVAGKKTKGHGGS